jgi:hypothetical protein
VRGCLGSYFGYCFAGAACAALSDFDLPVKKEMTFWSRLCFCGADRVSGGRSVRPFERRRPPRRRPERCVSFSFIADYQVFSFFRMGGALRGSTQIGRSGGTVGRKFALATARESKAAQGNRRGTPHVGSSRAREARRGSHPGLAPARNGASGQVAEGKGEKTQNGSQHTHGSQTGGSTTLWLSKALGAPTAGK